MEMSPSSVLLMGRRSNRINPKAIAMGRLSGVSQPPPPVRLELVERTFHPLIFSYKIRTNIKMGGNSKFKVKIVSLYFPS